MRLYKLFLGVGLFLTAGSGMAFAQETKQEVKTVPQDKVAELVAPFKSEELLADGVQIKNLISAAKNEREKEIQERELWEELSAPAEDIYGEDSWGNSVSNPMADKTAIPTEYDIDLTGFVAPIKFHRVNSKYGWRRRRMHHGIDLKLFVGEPVRAAFDGKVRVKAYNGSGYGYYYVIRHPNGLETVYGHLSEQIAEEGQIVKAGEIIGLGGNTGRSTGPHLHFEARFCGIPINPQDLFDFETGEVVAETYAFSRYGRAKYKGAKIYGKSKDELALYVVKSGDSLSKIAYKFGTTVNRIMQVNGLVKGQMIHPNSKLLIP